MNPAFFKGNRNSLNDLLDGGVVVLSAYGRQQRSNDSAYSFTQESNFWYLCGVEEPDWVLVMDGAQSHSWLIMPDVDDVHRTFDGSLSASEAKRISGVDQVVTADEGMTLLRTLAKRHGLVRTIDQPSHAEYFNFSLNPSIMKHRQMLERTFQQVQDCRKELAKLRAVKQPAEVKMIQKAVDVTIKAFEEVHKNLPTYKNEFEIEAVMGYAMRMNGADGHAYDPIVASGINACTLHYGHNRSTVRVHELVLMDVGAQFGGYAADITRTYAKASPTKRQREIHRAVEDAHNRIIDLISPMKSVEEYQKDVDLIMSEALRSIGLAHDETGVRRYMPHAVSHGLGIDVHDSLGAPKHFKEGMVLTVEPGIYVPEEKIGVRIEDDILVTASGRKNLSGRLSTGL